MTWYKLIFIIVLIALAGFLYNFAKQTQSLSSAVSPVTDGKDLIIITYPTRDTVITSPLVVTGKARGSWYFEGDFPVVLTDWDGLIIAEGYAEAKGGWMTPAYVPFEATLNFSNPATDQDFTHRGALILKKDNPSGLPANDASVEIPIRFK